MPTSIITTDDLREFQMELLQEIKGLLTQKSRATMKKWLKSPDVMEMFMISPGNLGINLPYTKIDGFT